MYFSDNPTYKKPLNTQPKLVAVHSPRQLGSTNKQSLTRSSQRAPHAWQAKSSCFTITTHRLHSSSFLGFIFRIR